MSDLPSELINFANSINLENADESYYSNNRDKIIEISQACASKLGDKIGKGKDRNALILILNSLLYYLKNNNTVKKDQFMSQFARQSPLKSQSSTRLLGSNTDAFGLMVKEPTFGEKKEEKKPKLPAATKSSGFSMSDYF